MLKLHLITAAIVFLGLVSVKSSAQVPGVIAGQSLDGRYERIGAIDPAIEAEYRGTGLVLVEPVLIDEYILFPSRGSRKDTEFMVQRRGPADYLLILPNAGLTRALVELGQTMETKDGSLLLHRETTITGEGASTVRGDREDRFTKEKGANGNSLVIETKIVWTQRFFFRKKKMEYRSIVRFRQL